MRKCKFNSKLDKNEERIKKLQINFSIFLDAASKQNAIN